MTQKALAAALAVIFLTAAAPARAANKEHQQLMADLRMLQEQSQLLQNLIGSVTEALKAVNTRLDQQGETTPASSILDLTVCEPALGSGAFLIEAVNQLAAQYLKRRQEELGQTIPAEEYQAELESETALARRFTEIPIEPMSEAAVHAVLVAVRITAPAADVTSVPLSKKYFLGGATSVRGWGRYEISPLSEGLPIGGNSLLAFSEELRAVLRGNFGGVLFLDGGNVWAEGWTIKLNDLRYAIGPGLRYQTPIGPIRLDLGYQLNPIPGLLVNGAPQTRRWRIHFSIGQAY